MRTTLPRAGLFWYGKEINDPRMSFQEIKNFYMKYERHITTGAFLAGFIVDNLTLTRIDLLYDNFVLISYLAVAAGSIAFFHFTSTVPRERFFGRVRLLAPLAMQFAFGGLFSGFAIFYTRSASLAASWPFLLVLLLLLIGNELLKKRYARYVFQMSMLFFVLFSYLIFFLPIMLHAIGAWVFLLSGAASLAIIFFFTAVLALVAPGYVRKSRRALTASIGGIFLLVNVFYFANIIPPIPLSLKEAGVYHSVSRTNGDYLVEHEPRTWRDLLKSYDDVHVAPQRPVYVFSSVFAPTDLDTDIFHSWQYYDQTRSEWVEANRIGFAIVGGRDGGYRGYSFKTNVPPGRWRVDVVTARGQLLGRVKFNIIAAETPPVLETAIR